MIITIDGPAGAGKSTVARRLAERLAFRILDTGAMYRAVTWAAIDRGIPLDDAERVAALAESLPLEIDGGRVAVEGRDLSAAIRRPEVSHGVSTVADHPRVRRILTERQRAIAAAGDFVCEGRDQGTEAFPHAEIKIFLTASSDQRAQRRWEELLAAGHTCSLETVVAQQTERDRRDLERPVGALRPAADAIQLPTDGLSIEQVVDALEAIVRKRLAEVPR